MVLNDKIYNVLKWVCLIALPAIAWAYSQLGDVWGLPLVTEVPRTINIIATLLGVLIGVSQINYEKAKETEKAE